MSLPFYLNFIAASCIFIFGIKGQFPSGFLMQSPQEFLSSNTCPYSPTITCPTSPTFRLIDGSCNNAGSPYSGKSGTPYVRITPPMYLGTQTPRNISFFGTPLPDPRKISLDFFQSTSAESSDLSAIASTFARFVEHDLYKTKLLDASTCCTASQSAGVCDNIAISDTDTYFQTYLKRCLPKGNIVASKKLDCQSGGPVEQINENTHPLDLSNIYGSTSAVSDRLRTKTDGLLKVSDTNNLLPTYTLTECKLPTPNTNNEHCFDAGDLRVNVDPLIMTMYTVWVRHHNVIASKLKYILKDASDENIFQTARQIVIAQYQHIVYNELLPVFDKNTPSKTAETGTSLYVSTKKPSIFNTFSLVYTAIVDSMVPSKITVDGSEMLLDTVFYNPTQLFKTDGIKNMLEAMQKAKAEKVDRFVVEALTNTYLQGAPGSGTDKVALNIQQSRENGAACYFIFYSILNGVFDGTLAEKDTSITTVDVLYPNEVDIELLPGLFSENLATDALYGKTTQKLMNKQFEDLKYGDPFFYSHSGVFTPEKFTDIKKTKLAKILCNGDLVDVLPNALKVEATENSPGTCASLDDIDICLWSTADWSDWINLGCFMGKSVHTRQCNILPGSSCTCKGEPIKFDSCPMSLFQNIVDVQAIQKINDTFYQNFGHDGKPLNPNTPNFVDILRGLAL